MAFFTGSVWLVSQIHRVIGEIRIGPRTLLSMFWALRTLVRANLKALIDWLTLSREKPCLWPSLASPVHVLWRRPPCLKSACLGRATALFLGWVISRRTVCTGKDWWGGGPACKWIQKTRKGPWRAGVCPERGPGRRLWVAAGAEGLTGEASLTLSEEGGQRFRNKWRMDCQRVLRNVPAAGTSGLGLLWNSPWSWPSAPALAH